VADGGPVTVSASYNAVTGTRIAGNVQPEVKAKLILDGRSVIGGEPIVLTVPRGELLALDGEDAPFYVDRPETV